jgi:hypothetical protein
VACGTYEKKRGTYRVLVGRSEGMRLLGRPRLRWDGNIKWIFKTWDGKAWIRLIWLRIGTGGGGLMNAVINLRVA